MFGTAFNASLLVVLNVSFMSAVFFLQEYNPSYPHSIAELVNTYETSLILT